MVFKMIALVCAMNTGTDLQKCNDNTAVVHKKFYMSYNNINACAKESQAFLAANQEQLTEFFNRHNERLVIRCQPEE